MKLYKVFSMIHPHSNDCIKHFTKVCTLITVGDFCVAADRGAHVWDSLCGLYAALIVPVMVGKTRCKFVFFCFYISSTNIFCPNSHHNIQLYSIETVRFHQSNNNIKLTIHV